MKNFSTSMGNRKGKLKNQGITKKFLDIILRFRRRNAKYLVEQTL